MGNEKKQTLARQAGNYFVSKFLGRFALPIKAMLAVAFLFSFGFAGVVQITSGGAATESRIVDDANYYIKVNQRDGKPKWVEVSHFIYLFWNIGRWVPLVIIALVSVFVISRIIWVLKNERRS